MRYLNESLVREAFLRLRQNEDGGKTGLERTSALMCFLAFDALLKRTGITPPLDFDPDVSNGKNNREGLTREFTRLVQLKNGSTPYHVLNLGKVEVGGNPPEKRFSSNFLTVSLKKATTSQTATEYPTRPSNPLLLMGQSAVKITWGIDRHPDWRENLPVFLQSRKTKIPFHDLACFVLRQRGFVSEAQTLQEGLMDGLREIFTPELCDFWQKQLSLERVYAPKIENPFQDTPCSPFQDLVWLGDSQPMDDLATLESRVEYLEGLLRMHHIAFEERA